MHRFAQILPLLLVGAAAPAPRPIVLELFTSQSCSSCPPADALLADLAATRSDVLPLDFHVDYWNYLSWHDRFSLPEATARQRAYAALLGSEVYTPQLVIDGERQAVGSERTNVLAAIKAARESEAGGPQATLSARDGQWVVDIGAGNGGGTILLIGFDAQHVTQVGSGENAGRTLREVNVVRSLTKLGSWHGGEVHLMVPRPAGDAAALLVQAENGAILAAATS
ncbi:MAG TPA: DUF1223 domain-containing protein [Acetobacteraceae bacterium]|nr:DUF1223 domain-containing protein [Acetobacteraceae bacterium]